jgi:hypothetical protein
MSDNKKEALTLEGEKITGGAYVALYKLQAHFSIKIKQPKSQFRYTVIVNEETNKTYGLREYADLVVLAAQAPLLDQLAKKDEEIERLKGDLISYEINELGCLNAEIETLKAKLDEVGKKLSGYEVADDNVWYSYKYDKATRKIIYYDSEGKEIKTTTHYSTKRGG